MVAPVNRVEVVAILEAVGASGMMTIISALVTAKLSGSKQAQANPNGARDRLNNEVAWLREQVAVARSRGFMPNYEDTEKPKGLGQ